MGHVPPSPPRWRSPCALMYYFAYVRSEFEYCCVIWEGAATVHTERINKTRHKFLTCLNAHSRNQSTSICYSDMLTYFTLCSMAARRTQNDIMFIRNVLNGRVRSSFLISAFSFCVPVRFMRPQARAPPPRGRGDLSPQYRKFLTLCL